MMPSKLGLAKSGGGINNGLIILGTALICAMYKHTVNYFFSTLHMYLACMYTNLKVNFVEFSTSSFLFSFRVYLENKTFFLYECAKSVFLTPLDDAM